LIDTLHGYTQIESGVEFEPVEMREIMSDTLTDLDSLIHRRSARITHNELPAIFGNGPQLKQLLQNLIGNSIKFCDAPVPVVHISATRQEGNTWLFTLKDNGIGIPEESRRRIFDPFKRLHGLGKYEGTGLGLATCKRIVERHSGNIWCESHNDYGVTFSFTLPGSAGKPERTAPREPISIVRKLNPPLQAVQQRCQ
jgi:signal transduction histidine kinase